MPRVVEVKSLVKLCTHCIKNTIERNKDYASYVSKRNDKSFHQLPVSLLEGIIQSFTSTQKLMDANILQVFISPQLQHLTFTVYYANYYESFFPKLGNLLILNLEKTEVRDGCLKSIGIYCSKLRSLNLNHCLYVTDTGIQWLCGVDYPDMTNGNKSGLCKTLKKLSIFHTSVTHQGIQVALTNLLSLNILENVHILEALVELAQSAIAIKSPGFYNDMFSVSTLYAYPNAPHYKSNSLQLAIPLCQSINHVSIHVAKGLKDSDLLSLLSVKMLRKLKIFKSRISSDCEITFDGGVTPLLKVFGSSLETLALECLNFIRISSVIELCPNLNVLYISDVTGSLNNERDLFFRVGKNMKSPVFKELKILICVGEIPVEILIFLLSSPLLEYVGISRCDSLTDNVFLETIKCHHRFRNIRQMQIDHCDYVTERGIDALLINDRNPLEIIDIYKCQNIAIQSFANWRSLIAKKNWNLNITRKS